MQDDEKPKVATDDAPQDNALPANDSADNSADDSADNSDDNSADNLTDEAEAAAPEESLEDKLAAANDQLLRALAELENTRRRAERDRGEALKYGAMSFARDMVGVADNLHRALKAIDDADEAAVGCVGDLHV